MGSHELSKPSSEEKRIGELEENVSKSLNYQKEYIVCACINYKGNKVGGRNIRNCIDAITGLVGEPDAKEINHNQGFITSTGRFVDREEAWVIAKDNNQIKYEIIKDFGNMTPFLMSINLFND